MLEENLILTYFEYFQNYLQPYFFNTKDTDIENTYIEGTCIGDNCIRSTYIGNACVCSISTIKY